MHVNSDTVLCSGTYYINDEDMNGAIIINASDITLDCNGSILNGNRAGGSAGISNGYLNLASGEVTNGYYNVNLKNCIIENYFIGISWINATGGLVENNTINNCVRVGIESYYSINDTYTDNTVDNTYGTVCFDGSCFSNFAGIEIRYSTYTNLINNTATNNKHGIFIGESEHASLINNTAMNNLHGIAVLLFNHATLDSNTAEENSETGFAVIESTYIDLYKNHAINNMVGIGVQANHSTLTENTVSGGYAGLGIISGTRNTSLVGEVLKNISLSVNLTHNPHPPKFCYNITLVNNTADNINVLPWYFPTGFGIALEECENIAVGENKVDSNAFAGIVLLDSWESSVKYNNVSDNNGYGLYSEYSQNLTIESNNILENQGNGINIYGSDYETISLNNIGFNKLGIRIIDSSGWDIINNTIFNNTDGDILVDPSEDIRIIDNEISGSSYGIELIEVSNTEVANNLVEFNNIGAFVANSSDFNIVGNIFRNNTDSNIIIDPSSGFTISGNDLSYSQAGIKIADSNNGILLGNLLQYNDYGIINLGSSGISTKNSVIAGSAYYDVWLEDSDSTLTNTTFDSEKVNITGPSLLSVKWYLDARVFEIGCQNPLLNAFVFGYDNNNTLAFNVTTDINGSMPLQELLEYVENSTDRFYYSPYVIHTEKDDFITDILLLEMNRSLSVDIILSVNATDSEIDIDPDTINLGSNGKFIKAFIEVPGYDVSGIDINTVMINKAIPAINDTKYGFVKDPTIEDRDDDDLMEYMAVFYRSDLIPILEVGNNTLGVTGKIDSDSFAGTDIVEVIG